MGRGEIRLRSSRSAQNVQKIAELLFLATRCFWQGADLTAQKGQKGSEESTRKRLGTGRPLGGRSLLYRSAETVLGLYRDARRRLGPGVPIGS